MRYGEIYDVETQAALDLELKAYWESRAEQEKALKAEESRSKKRARDRKSSRVYYIKTKEELREAKRQAWHTARKKRSP